MAKQVWESYFRFLFAYEWDFATGSQGCQPLRGSRSKSGFGNVWGATSGLRGGGYRQTLW